MNGDAASDHSALDDDLATFGQVREQPLEPEAFEVWPENWDMLLLFDGLRTQWRVDGMSGQVLGLDYPGVETVLRIRGVADPSRAFDDLCIMERAALGAMRKQHGR